jgi:hypothetical protein
MAFTIIKAGEALKKATAPAKPDAPKPKGQSRTDATRGEMKLWGIVGHKHRKDGSIEAIYSSVPESEASPWLKGEKQPR